VTRAWINPAVRSLRSKILDLKLVDPMHVLLHAAPERGTRLLWFTYQDLDERLAKLNLEELVSLEEALISFRSSLSVKLPEARQSDERFFENVLTDIATLTGGLGPIARGSSYRKDVSEINEWGFWKY